MVCSHTPRLGLAPNPNPLPPTQAENIVFHRKFQNNFEIFDVLCKYVHNTKLVITMVNLE